MYTEKEQKEIGEMEAFAYDYTTYKVGCVSCSAEGSKEEYASSAAETAWEEGFRLCKIKGEYDKDILCKKCQEKEGCSKT